MIIFKIKRFLYRMYRRLKNHYLTHDIRFDTKIFFYFVKLINFLLSPKEKNKKLDNISKKKYSLKWGPTPIYKIICNSEVAKDSDDHKFPHGAKFNNSINHSFNYKLYDYFNHRKDLLVLDLGCSGGGFVRSVLEDGFTAIGLEGSSIPKKFKLQEWKNCPHHLFTCDISDYFFIKRVPRIEKKRGRWGKEKLKLAKFHCITMWEVLEHIPEDKLAILFRNIFNHLSSQGIFVASIDTSPDGNPLIGATYHHTVKPKNWWLNQFDIAGFTKVKNHKFKAEDYVRGHGLDFLNWHPSDGEGFHVVLRKK